MQNKVLIVDFGSQYTQLIARRIRELFIYCEISPFNNLPEDLNQYKAIVLSGSPFSVNQENSPEINLKIIGLMIIYIVFVSIKFYNQLFVF